MAKNIASKQFGTWLIVDYRSGKFRVASTKRKPTIKATEIPIDMKITVNVPETPQYKATGTINISETKMDEITLEGLSIEE